MKNNKRDIKAFNVLRHMIFGVIGFFAGLGFMYSLDIFYNYLDLHVSSGLALSVIVISFIIIPVSFYLGTRILIEDD